MIFMAKFFLVLLFKKFLNPKLFHSTLRALK